MKCRRVQGLSRIEAAAWEIESDDSTPDNPPPVRQINTEVCSFDRPGISAFNKSRDISIAPETSTNTLSTLPKSDLIKKWLMTADTERNDSTLNSSFNSIVNDSPPGVKRLLRSPLRQLNELKRRRLDEKPNNSTERLLTKCLTSPVPRDSRTLKENHEGTDSPRTSERISVVSSPARTHESIETVRSSLSPRSKLAACRAVIFGTKERKSVQQGENHQKSPRKMMEDIFRPSRPPEEPPDSINHVRERVDPPLERLISQCDSPPSRNIEIDSSSPSQNSESLRILDVLSVSSSKNSEEVIDSRSSDGHIPEENVSLEDDVSLEEDPVTIENAEDDEQDCDRTLQALIEDPEGEFPEIENNNVKRLQNIQRVESDDSDRTYYSEGTPVDRTLIEECISQQISESLSNQASNFKSNLTISENSVSVEASPSSRKNEGEVYPSIVHKPVKKKKKAKKGSILERFQTLISGKISFLRMWRHQMGQARFKGTCNQCVIMRIKKFSISYGRPYFQGAVIKDSFNLLGKTVPTSNLPDLRTSASDESLGRTITVLTIPEIVGQFTVKKKSALKFYPPWEVIDADKLILSVLHFKLIPDDSEESLGNGEPTVNDVIIHEFDCPCLRAGRLVNSCSKKFTNSKPNPMEYFLK